MPNTKKLSPKAYMSHMELEKIIEDFGDAMRNANMEYVSRRADCPHDIGARFTPGMQQIWNRYIVYAMKQQ